MIEEVKYQTFEGGGDNATEVSNFVGDQPACEKCGGSGEYESGFGPKGCQLCNSRLIPFVDANGDTRFADWGDTIERREDGLHLIAFDWEAMIKRTQTVRAAIIEDSDGERSVTGSIPCPLCADAWYAVKYSIASNGHVHAACENPDCVRWME